MKKMIALLLRAVPESGKRGKRRRGVFHVRREGHHPLCRLALAFTL